MRLWPFGQVETKDATLADPELLFLLTGTTTGSISRAQALAVPPVNAAIRSISEAAAVLDVKVVRVADNGIETDAPDHPVAKFLRGPVNDWTSRFEFVRDLVAQALTSDAGGIGWVNRVNGEVREIIQYTPGIITVTPDVQTQEPRYRTADRKLNAGDVIHLRGPFSQCALSMAMSAIEVSWHLENHAKQLFKGGARPGGVIEFPKGLGDEGLKKMKVAWRSAFEGSANAGKTAVLWDGAKFSPFTFNSTDAQFLENRRFQVEEIARAFQIPPQMLGDLTKSSYANAEQKQKEFLQYCLEPWLRGLEASFRRALFTADERQNYRVVFDRDDLTRASLTERATAINSLRASEVLSPNEGRDWLGLHARPGGDTYDNPNITVKPAAVIP